MNSTYPALAAGSSPHTRGARGGGGAVDDGVRIIPAYAGSTFLSHPFNVSSTGSSPHTRGARPLWRDLSHRSRIIPAYAGSTAFAKLREAVAEDHPRIRGEHSTLTG